VGFLLPEDGQVHRGPGGGKAHRAQADAAVAVAHFDLHRLIRLAHAEDGDFGGAGAVEIIDGLGCAGDEGAGEGNLADEGAGVGGADPGGGVLLRGIIGHDGQFGVVVAVDVVEGEELVSGRGETSQLNIVYGNPVATE
jgi:hypothetical protein